MAFTFYKLANIIIDEIPKLLDKINYKIQILVIDLLDTLFKTNRKISKIDLKKDFDENAKILDDIIDNLSHISDKYFMIVSYNDIKNIAFRSILSKFKNVVQISENYGIFKEKGQIKIIQIYN